ncbi:MAG: Xaa-Pro peptidase family protein [Pseudoprimorskyibacter sp.]|nr:Xaa-Pro peptidase family protein [Pseudoprimorskyibacter sp.]
MSPLPVLRGFDVQEYKARVARAQSAMASAQLDALLLTTEPELRYFTGFLTRFWESPTRPWFLVVPAAGDPIAVIPSIGAHLMGQSWIDDIRTWRSPDLEDDGLSLLAETLRDVLPAQARIAIPDGHETHVRMPWADLQYLSQSVLPMVLTGDQGILRALRLVKSPAEIEKIRQTCGIAARAFERVPEIASTGVELSQVFRQFQCLCLQEGADWVAYLAGGAGRGGYRDVISPAGDIPLAKGDVLMLDTGVVLDGYFCDFDRNFAVGPVAQASLDAHARLIEATHAGFAAARPGASAADLFHAMDQVLTGGAGGSDAGRYGHGLGLQLTEWPSLIPGDHTRLEVGMVLTLEPGLQVAPGVTLVHEENIHITPTGADWLTEPAKDMIRI